MPTKLRSGVMKKLGIPRRVYPTRSSLIQCTHTAFPQNGSADSYQLRLNQGSIYPVYRCHCLTSYQSPQTIELIFC